MDRNQAAVMDFHAKFGCTIGTFPDLRDKELAAKLILEEAVETVAAMGYDVRATIVTPDAIDVAQFEKFFPREDIIEVIDGLADLEYVLKGAAVRFGIDLQPFFEEVHETNMAKEGGQTRADGKILKPEGWKPPDIQKLLYRQEANAAIWAQMEQEALDDNDSPIEVINAAESAA